MIGELRNGEDGDGDGEDAIEVDGAKMEEEATQHDRRVSVVNNVKKC